MNKEEFKNKVINWLLRNNINITNKRIRVYKYRGEWEVRIYHEPIKSFNLKKSFREDKELTAIKNDGRRHGKYGIFQTTITPYTHINETDLKNKNERDFILEMLKTN
jgi:hypothetical protein